MFYPVPVSNDRFLNSYLLKQATSSPGFNGKSDLQKQGPALTATSVVTVRSVEWSQRL